MCYARTNMVGIWNTCDSYFNVSTYQLARMKMGHIDNKLGIKR